MIVKVTVDVEVMEVRSRHDISCCCILVVHLVLEVFTVVCSTRNKESNCSAINNDASNIRSGMYKPNVVTIASRYFKSFLDWSRCRENEASVGIGRSACRF